MIGYRYNCLRPINHRPTTISQRLREEEPDIRDLTSLPVVRPFEVGFFNRSELRFV